MKKRVFFEKNNQKDFIQYVKKQSGFSWKDLAIKLEVNISTLKRSYLYGLCSIPYKTLNKMSDLANENENKIINKFQGVIRNEEKVIGRKVFGEQKNTFNPITIEFEKDNLQLNCSNVSYSKYDKEKKIKLPNKITPELAEEIGMHYGDGFLSNKENEYRLKGNPKDEIEYYNNYIGPLFKKLYNLDLNIKKFENTFGFEIKSKALWEFKTKIIGINSGKKYDITFPESLKVNNEEIITSFLRGLFDTDGSLDFKSKYGYKKYYPSIGLMLSSKNLIKEVGKLLTMLGFKPGIYFNDRYGRIQLYGVGAFKRYEKLIGWSSQKNLNRVQKWKSMYPQLNMVDVA